MGAIGDLAGESHMAVTACFSVIAGLVPAMTMGGTQRWNRSYAVALALAPGQSLELITLSD